MSATAEQSYECRNVCDMATPIYVVHQRHGAKAFITPGIRCCSLSLPCTPVPQGRAILHLDMDVRLIVESDDRPATLIRYMHQEGDQALTSSCVTTYANSYIRPRNAMLRASCSFLPFPCSCCRPYVQLDPDLKSSKCKGLCCDKASNNVRSFTCRKMQFNVMPMLIHTSFSSSLERLSPNPK